MMVHLATEVPVECEERHTAYSMFKICLRTVEVCAGDKNTDIAHTRTRTHFKATRSSLEYFEYDKRHVCRSRNNTTLCKDISLT